MINSTQMTVVKTEEKSDSVNDRPLSADNSRPSNIRADSSFFSEDSLSCSSSTERRGLKRSIETEEEDDEDDEDFDDGGEYAEDDQFKDIDEEETQEEEEEASSSGSGRSWGTLKGLRKQRGSNRSYVLRPRTGMRRSWVEGGTPSPRGGRRGRGKSAPKSKYRRYTANARERDRMREINIAFANLRGALPSFTCRRVTSMTKIKTLKLAASYIRALTDLLSETPSEESKALALQLFQDFPSEQTDFVSSIAQTLSSSSSSPDQSHSHIPQSLKTTSKTESYCSSPTLEAALTGPSKRATSSNFAHQSVIGSRSNLIRPPPLHLSNSPTTSHISSPPPPSPLTPKNYPNSPVFPNPTIVTANVNVISLQGENVHSDTNNLFSYSPSSRDSFKNFTHFQSNAHFPPHSEVPSPKSVPFISNVPSSPQKNLQLPRHFSATNSPCHNSGGQLSHSSKLQPTHSFPASQHFSQQSSYGIKVATSGSVGVALTNPHFTSDNLQDARNLNPRTFLGSNDMHSNLQVPHSTRVMQETSSTSFGAHGIPSSNAENSSTRNIPSVHATNSQIDVSNVTTAVRMNRENNCSSNKSHIPPGNSLETTDISLPPNIILRDEVGPINVSNVQHPRMLQQTQDYMLRAPYQTPVAHHPTNLPQPSSLIPGPSSSQTDGDSVQISNSNPLQLNLFTQSIAPQCTSFQLSRGNNDALQNSAGTSGPLEDHKLLQEEENRVLIGGVTTVPKSEVPMSNNSWSSHANTGFSSLLEEPEQEGGEGDLSWEEICWNLE